MNTLRIMYSKFYALACLVAALSSNILNEDRLVSKRKTIK